MVSVITLRLHLENSIERSGKHILIFHFKNIEKSVHYPSSEQGSQQVFDQDVMKFLEKNNINNHFQNELTSLLSESNF